MSTDYTAPLDDIRFALDHLADLPAILGLSDFAWIDRDTVEGVVEESGRFFAEVVAPLNGIGDTQGSVLQDDGTVRTPDGWTEAYQACVEAGWLSVGAPEVYGGGGFPHLVGISLQEMISSAGIGFSLCPMLTHSGIDCLAAYGSETQREMYLTKLVSGEWTGTMCLTEPQAGSDVGAVASKARPVDDGTYRISGTKIYITYGDHEMTDNIVHIVLARTPGAPPGTKGISCFIVPKYLVNDDGSLGERNDVTVVSLEHKLGIHASPTCVLSFGDNDGAVGYLIGEENQGMRYMFTMMNNARLGVGLQGLAIAERAYQQTVVYAVEREQGRAMGGDGSISPIIDHADVRRMLLTMRSQIEAVRGLVYLNAAALDHAHHGDSDATAAAEGLAALLTPMTKAWGTDVGVEIASLAVQIHGGMGFIEETGVAQHYRDARIAPIYEGTNGIQALDLVGRKLGLSGGAVADSLLDQIASVDADLASAGESLSSLRSGLSEALQSLRVSVRFMNEAKATSPIDAFAGATPMLTQFSLVVGAWMHAQSAVAAQKLLVDGTDKYSTDFLEAKIVTAQFYGEHILPRAEAEARSARAGSAAIMALSPAQLGA
ncbi:MAG: acyl-CoA dehydrogenase [Acidimicrobiales bacterium]